MKIILIIIGIMFAHNLNANEPYRFKVWLQQFKQEALAEGISPEVVDRTIRQAKLLPKVIRFDRSQPEFVSSFSNYVSKRVTETRIAHGQDMLYQHRPLLQQVENAYQVPKSVLLAFWGLETNYGSTLGNYGLVSSLSTLAYEGRRADFFKSQLLSLMQIAEGQRQPLSQMRGSWAGAFGHMQFMPSTFLQYAIDADRDGKINLWQSLPDAFGSAANYLSNIGWRYGEPIALKVKLPQGFNYQMAHLKERHNVAFWRSLGVQVPRKVADLDNAAVILPQGWQGPAFMVFNNFDVVMDWNRSVNYALSVALLADRIKGESSYTVVQSEYEPRMSYQQVKVLQTKLNALGYDSGKPDGFPGLKTQHAVRQYQLQRGLPADGYANLDLYYQLIKQ